MSTNSNNHSLNSQNRTCEPCRKRKIKCNKELPCSNCVHRGINCVAQNRGRGRPMKLLDTFDRYEYNLNELEYSFEFKSSFELDTMRIPSLILTAEDSENPYYILLGTLNDIVKYELSPIMIKYFLLIVNLEIANKQQDVLRVIQNKLTSSSTNLNYQNVYNLDQINCEVLQHILHQMTKDACIVEKNLNASYIHQTINLKSSFYRNEVAWCIRIIDNKKHELYYTVNELFRQLFCFEEISSQEKIYNNLIAKIIHPEYHQLFFHAIASTLINLTCESSVVVQCVDKTGTLIPCQINLHILGIFPNELSCCAMEFLPLTPLHALSNNLCPRNIQKVPNTINCFENENAINELNYEDQTISKVLLMLRSQYDGLETDHEKNSMNVNQSLQSNPNFCDDNANNSHATEEAQRKENHPINEPLFSFDPFFNSFKFNNEYDDFEDF